MQRLRELIRPAIFAIIFIFLTAYLSSSGYCPEFLFQFCFLFHVYPFGIGFSGGDTYLVLIYYIVLWIVLTILFLGMWRLITLIFKRSS
jgi:hypothetical protein